MRERSSGDRGGDQEHPGRAGVRADPRADRGGPRRARASGFDGAVLVVSFNPSSIAASKLVAPDVPTGFLTTDLVPPAGGARSRPPPATTWSCPAGPRSRRDLVRRRGARSGSRLGRGPWTTPRRFGCCSIAGSTPSRPTTPGWRSPCSPTTSVREPASPTAAGTPRGPASAFDDLLPPLERARAALTESVPGTRLPGPPARGDCRSSRTGP